MLDHGHLLPGAFVWVQRRAFPPAWLSPQRFVKHSLFLCLFLVLFCFLFYLSDIIDLQFEYTLKNGLVTSVPAIARNVREVAITVTARTQEKDIEFKNNPYRFETYTSSVYLRNLGT